MITNKQIWIFKEKRSGSTWFCNALEKKINRKCYDYPARQNIENRFINDAHTLRDLNYVYTTHHLKLLKHINLLDKETIIIRLTRRNRLEHCLSILGFILFPRHKTTTHLFVDPIKRNALPVEKESLYSTPIAVLKQEVRQIMLDFKKDDILWNTYSKNYNNFTVVYEDLENGVLIEPLRVELKFSDDTSTVIKSFDYKKDAFINYEQVVEWCHEYEEKFELEKH